MSAAVMTPKHPRWEEFMDRICGEEGGVTCCQHDHRHARAILAQMGDIDIPASIAFFEDHGGYCDCEVRLNVILGD